MTKDYLWDSQAATKIEKQELDKHFNENKAHYVGIIKSIWEVLNANCERPTYLKHDDLYEPLFPMFVRDSKLKSAFDTRGLPWNTERGGAQWLSWYTHYVVESYMKELDGGAK